MQFFLTFHKTFKLYIYSMPVRSCRCGTSFVPGDKGSKTPYWGATGLPRAYTGWIHFDFVPEEKNIRMGSADITGKLCVIGSKLDEDGIAALFNA